MISRDSRQAGHPPGVRPLCDAELSRVPDAEGDARGRADRARPAEGPGRGQHGRVQGLGFAGDYVQAMWLMLQQPEPEDYVIATGESHSVRDLLQVAFNRAGIDDWRPYVEQDRRFFRPADVSVLVGDATKAHERLGWYPKIGFQELIEMMVDADLANEKRTPGRAEG